MPHLRDQETSARKAHAAFWSMIASGGMTLAKLTVGLLSGSLSLLSEAGHGLIDTSATAMTYFAVRIADRPADESHPFGHGKVESIAALSEAGLLFALSVFVMIEAIKRLFHPEPIKASALAVGVLILSICIDLWRWRGLALIARETHSAALAADALHFSSDLLSSVCVLIAIGFVALGFERADAIAAVMMALLIATASFRLARSTIDALVDRAPDGAADQIRMLVTAVPGVVGVKEIRLRQVGGEILGDVNFIAARNLSLEGVAQIKARILAAIAEKMPQVIVVLVATAAASEDETILERVLLTAAQRRLFVHHFTLQNIDGHKCISLDLEIDAGMAYGQAHSQADELESAIRKELGEDVEVEIHVEPLEASELAGVDLSDAQVQIITAALQRQAIAKTSLTQIHDIRARENAEGWVVNYHCYVDGALCVAAVHEQVDILDRALRSEFPIIARIVGHAEPVMDHKSS